MKIELYGRNGCSRCEQSKKFLRDNSIDFVEYEVGKDVPREVVLEKFPDAKMLPVVVVDGTWIGGRDELIFNLKTILEANKE
jgi:glutaredoxin